MTQKISSSLRVVGSIFPGYKSARVLPVRNIDTISGRYLGKNAFRHYNVTDVDGRKYDIVIKRKNDLVVPLGAIGLSPNVGVFLKVARTHKIFGFNNGQRREKLFYEKIDDSLRDVLPKVLGMFESMGGRNVTLVMEEFGSNHEIETKDLYRIIDAITDFHAMYYGQKEIVREMGLNHYTPTDYRRARKVLRALFDYYREDNMKLYGAKLMKILGNFLENINQEYAEAMDYQTLTHNDLTPRNISVDGDKIIIYDWELACFQNPEHDLIELLISALNENESEKQIKDLVIYFRKQIENKTKRGIDDTKFTKILRFNALEYCVNRLAIYRSYCKRKHDKSVRKYERNARKVLEVCV